MSKERHKFQLGDTIIHRKHDAIKYIVIGVPQEGWMIEETLEPAYIYTAVIPPDDRVNRKWIRPETQMEDGRFTKIS